MRADAASNIVLDASVALSWCFEDERTPAMDLLLSQSVTGIMFIVPAIWPLEVANILSMAVRKHRITYFRSMDLFRLLLDLPVVLEHIDSRYVFDRVFSVAQKTSLTVYDASYLELAMTRKLKLATRDQALLKAAQDLGVGIWNVEEQ